MAGSRPLALRDDYAVFQPITTRWADNDLYGHINNVTYYAFFDTAVNRFLIEQGGLDIQNGNVIAYVVNSTCQYRQALAFPDAIEAGIRVEKLGNSSVTYGVGIFKAGASEASAFGEFVHVFVDRQTQKPVAIPTPIRAALERIARAPDAC
ncbi:acyl-CoA thioesterase [Mangrovitalea sediminis]|uniref:acyl-CoA thioesterase n=1 Tax=Mangrovitalea sediminis TaxID=1982043 RepID=UPI000BE5D4E2|nr:thioesterase family protein [Mangrovitalea sediminis]